MGGGLERRPRGLRCLTKATGGAGIPASAQILHYLQKKTFQERMSVWGVKQGMYRKQSKDTGAKAFNNHQPTTQGTEAQEILLLMLLPLETDASKMCCEDTLLGHHMDHDYQPPHRAMDMDSECNKSLNTEEVLFIGQSPTDQKGNHGQQTTRSVYLATPRTAQHPSSNLASPSPACTSRDPLHHFVPQLLCCCPGPDPSTPVS